MKRMIPGCICIALLFTSLAQVNGTSNEQAGHPSNTNSKPSFPGGRRALQYRFQSTLNYPDAAILNGIEGDVILKVSVKRNGALSSVRVIQGIGFGCDEEAERIVRSIRRWKPGRRNDIAVYSVLLLKVKFRLQ